MKTTTYNLLQVRIAPIVMDQLTNLSYISGISKQDLARMALAEFLEKKTTLDPGHLLKKPVTGLATISFTSMTTLVWMLKVFFSFLMRMK